LQEGYNNNVAIPESSFRLSTPQLLTSFLQPQPLHNERNENGSNENGNEISLVIEIPDNNDNFDNDDNSNSNIVLNADRARDSAPESSPDSQFGSM
jgi:hypothetical protein